MTHSKPDSLKDPLDVAYLALKSSGLDSFEVYAERKRVLRIDAKQQKVDSLTQAEDAGLSIRVLKDGKQGFSFTTALDAGSISAAVDSAIAIAREMPADPDIRLPQLSSSIARAVSEVDSQGLEVAMDQKIGLARDLESLTLQADKRMQAVRQASLGETWYSVELMDASGARASYQTTLFTASVSAKAQVGEDSQMGGDFSFAAKLKDLKLEPVARETARTATELLGAGSAPTLICPAILRHSVVADLLDFLSGSFSAEEVDKGRSILANRMGTAILSPKIRLVDDGTYKGGYATAPFDGEGTPSQRTPLTQGGKLVSFLYDLRTANKHGKKPTGNASRGIKSPPSASTTNLILEPETGTTPQSLELLMADMTRGILITDLMGVHTANEITGDFSLGASGLLIENGKITRPVRGFAVSGNVLDLFASCDGIADDVRCFGSVWTPSIRIPKLSVGGNE